MHRGAQIGAVTVTTVTMALLYYGLMELAREAGYTLWQSILFPFPIDGLVLVAYISAYSFTKKVHQAYAWAVVLLGASLSALGQFLHTQSLVGTVVHGVTAGPNGTVPTVQWWAPLLAVAPALASPLALHLAVTLTRITTPGRTTAPPAATTAPANGLPRNPATLTAREGWPTELEDDLKRIIANETSVAEVARRVVREHIRTQSPDPSNAAKLVRAWLKNYSA